MKYKTMTIFNRFLILFLIPAAILPAGCKQTKPEKHSSEVVTEVHTGKETMHHMHHMEDNRISLNLPPKKAKHQLMNMRNHLKAVRSIIDYLAKNEFDSASVVASRKLGLTDEMKMMCSSFGNKDFEKLGLEFHQSADRMSEIMKTKDKSKALNALLSTLNYCITCHATFKQ